MRYLPGDIATAAAVPGLGVELTAGLMTTHHRLLYGIYAEMN